MCTFDEFAFYLRNRNTNFFYLFELYKEYSLHYILMSTNAHQVSYSNHLEICLVFTLNIPTVVK